MPRPEQITLAALNITMHPHSAEIYADRFRRAVDSHRERNEHVQLRGDFYGMIHTAFLFNDNEPAGGFEGSIFRFMEINKKDPWFNTLSAKPASREEMSDLRIPDHLRPKLSTIRYNFFPDIHTLVFVTKHKRNVLPADAAQLLFERILNHPSLAPENEALRPAKVNVIKSEAVLERILSIDRLDKLEIVYDKPNPDDPGDFEAEIEKALAKQHVGKIEAKYESDGTSDGITPDEKTKALARLAGRNGHVTGAGRDETGRTVRLSTLGQPQTTKYVATKGTNVSVAEWTKAVARSFAQSLLGKKSRSE